MSINVYINDLAAFLPNAPITNETIEDVLGKINGLPSRTKKIMLRNNKIRTRHYALDLETGRLTHTNAQMSAEAIRGLAPYDSFTLKDIECLCCGTSTPDLLIPGHALMVLGELGLPACEAVTTGGICISGMTAFKFAYLNIAAGCSDNAVACGSDAASSYLRSRFFSSEQPKLNDVDLEKKPFRAFDAEFLRWMLSDGAGAAFLSNRKNDTGPSLRVDWMEHVSYAGQLETCMYAGGCKQEDGRMVGWREVEYYQETQTKNNDTKNLATRQTSRYLIRQDTKLLEKEIVRTAIDWALAQAIKKHDLSPEEFDWYLPHYSSNFFRDKFYQAMKKIGFEIPYDRWFTNLSTKGNTGSASIYIIMEELFKSGQLQKGQKLLCFIPESGRFSHVFLQLSVV